MSTLDAVRAVVGKGDTAQARNVETGTWSGDWWIIERGLAGR